MPEPEPSRAARRTRRAILDAAATTLAWEPSASLGRIAEAAGVGRTTLHRHFPDRARLVAALAADAHEAAMGALTAPRADGSDGAAALARAVTQLIALGDRFAFLLRERTLSDDPDVADGEHREAAAGVELVARAQREGGVRADLHPEWVAHMLSAAIYGAWEAVAGGDLTREEAAGLVLTTMMDGLRPR